MRRRSFFGRVGDDVLVVKSPESGKTAGEILPPGHPDEKKRLRERAMDDLKKHPRYRRTRLFRWLAEHLLSRTLVRVVIGAGVLGGLAYDSFTHLGTWRSTAEQYVAVFGTIFALFLWRWSRH